MTLRSSTGHMISRPSPSIVCWILLNDNVHTETGIAYNPVTGEKTQYDWNAAGVTHGVFVEDTWKISQRVTLNYGLRWDDYGNPYSRSANTAFGNFFYGPGANLQEQIANGSVIQHHHALNRSITDVFSPRAGIAWDPDRRRKVARQRRRGHLP